MEIWVEFDGQTGKFRISPDPANVRRGTPVRWRFKTDNSNYAERIRWIVYFDHGNPFGLRTAEVITRVAASTLSGQSGGQHTAATGVMFADESGDYKYGVRAIDPLEGKTLGDDDPQLKVSD